jgi:hypothetical protein
MGKLDLEISGDAIGCSLCRASEKLAGRAFDPSERRGGRCGSGVQRKSQERGQVTPHPKRTVARSPL